MAGPAAIAAAAAPVAKSAMTPASAPKKAATTRGNFPLLLNGYTLDKVLLVLAFVFAIQHPAIQPGAAAKAKATARRLDDAWAATNYSTPRTGPVRVGPADVTYADGNLLDYFIGSKLGDFGAVNPNAVTFYEINEWKNSLFLPASVRAHVPHALAIWLRNMIAINLVYFGVGAAWCAWIYWLRRDTYFPVRADGTRGIPSWASVKQQMYVSVQAFPLYTFMPTMGEWLVERGLTRAYHSLAEVGGLQGYLIWSAVYLFGVEWGIYWVHRYLHDNKTLYLWLHHDHHKYNNGNDLTPFAGLAFHPIDGCLQASPYVVMLFLVPVHFWTFEVLLFFTGIWTANIHDALWGDTEPVMGSKYHTYHHTSYRDNYGQFFVFFDWVHGTLTDPDKKSYGVAEAGAAERELGVVLKAD